MEAHEFGKENKEKKEPNMKKALKILKEIYPASEDHPFAGFGH